VVQRPHVNEVTEAETQTERYCDSDCNISHTFHNHSHVSSFLFPELNSTLSLELHAAAAAADPYSSHLPHRCFFYCAVPFMQVSLKLMRSTSSLLFSYHTKIIFNLTSPFCLRHKNIPVTLPQ